MTDQELDVLMRRVLVDSIKLDLGADVNISFRPSLKYQCRMSSMLKDPLKWARKKTRPMWKAVVQKAAVILLIASLGFGGLMAGSPAARAAVARWFTEWRETWIIYHYYDRELPKKMPKYEITALPEEYMEIERNESSVDVSLLYENDEGYLISFDYEFMVNGALWSFETGNYEVSDITVKHMKGKLFLSTRPDGMSTVTWIDEKANIQFSLSGEADCVDLLRLAESISLVKTTK